MTPRRYRPRTGPDSSKASYHDFSEEERLRAERDLLREVIETIAVVSAYGGILPGTLAGHVFTVLKDLLAERDALKTQLAQVEQQLTTRQAWIDEFDRQTETALQQRDEAWAEFDGLQEQVTQAEQRVRALNDAIVWALGYTDFRLREPGEGAYWWRTELRQRCGEHFTPPPAEEG